jgi:hypothetical protein
MQGPLRGVISLHLRQGRGKRPHVWQVSGKPIALERTGRHAQCLAHRHLDGNVVAVGLARGLYQRL